LSTSRGGSVYRSPRFALRGTGGRVSDQVIRYETEQAYLDYTNHRRYLATGERVLTPDWGSNPDAYWNAHDAYTAAHPGAVQEMWTILLKEHRDPDSGKITRQDVEYHTLAYPTIEEGRASRKLVSEKEWEDPGKVIATFDSEEDAQKYIAEVLKQGVGYYYSIRHRTGVAVIDREIKSVE